MALRLPTAAAPAELKPAAVTEPAAVRNVLRLIEAAVIEAAVTVPVTPTPLPTVTAPVVEMVVAVSAPAVTPPLMETKLPPIVTEPLVETEPALSRPVPKLAAVAVMGPELLRLVAVTPPVNTPLAAVKLPAEDT